MSDVKTIVTEALERSCGNGETGRLALQRDNYEGQIYIYGGFIVHAQLGNLEGVPALFRLFDWGDANITWYQDEVSERSSLNLNMATACQLYAEHLQTRAGFDQTEKQKMDKAFETQSLSLGATQALDSALKFYTVTLECSDKSVLPDGYIFSERTKASYVIGSSEECDVILHHPSIDPLHCGVILEKGSVFVWDLGSQSGVRLNGHPIEQGPLKVGDVMTLGALDFHVRFNLRRPTIAKPQTVPIPAVAVPRIGSPPKQIPKGAITYEKVSKGLKNTEKGKPFLAKLGSLFGPKDK